MSLNRRSYILFILASFFFISCNPKASKESIVGKWVYKEMVFLPGSAMYEMSAAQKEAAGEDAKGTTFYFNKDGSYTVTPGNKQEEPLTGTYTIKDGTMTVKNERHPSGESTDISFPDKNTLKVEDKEKKMALVLERLD